MKQNCVWGGGGEIDVGCKERLGERCINGISFSPNNAESSVGEALSANRVTD
jgi:hypothetical protein